MPVYISPPPRNPLVQLVAAIVAVLALAGAFMLGLIALAVVAGLAVVIGFVAWVQAWRAKRRLRQATEKGQGEAHGEFIEAEYTVVSRRETSD